MPSARNPVQVAGSGESDYGNSLLAMDTTGRVFAGIDDCIALIGESGADAIEALCTGRGPEFPSP
jgi:hypothetical protein